MNNYVHGYSNIESERLADQAGTLAGLLHHDTRYPAGSLVLEAGCGIGAQTVLLAKNSPDARFICMDISKDSLERARRAAEENNLTNVIFEQADIFNLPFDEESLDHIFVCFVLEHLNEPLKALLNLKKILKTGGSITVIEGDHGSFYSHPESREAMLAVRCLIEIQARIGGNSLIGRQVYPILFSAGFKEIHVSPRMVYVDSSRPELVEGFSKKTFTAMVEGVREQALEMGLTNEETWNKGIRDLYRATEEDGTFCYTFFKGTGIKG